MKHRDKKTYGKEIISKDDVLRSRLIKFLLVLFILILFAILASCSTVKKAASSEGFVTDRFQSNGEQYIDVLFRSERGKADYTYHFSFYFPYPVEKKDEVVIVTKRYLDSLLMETNKKLPYIGGN